MGCHFWFGKFVVRYYRIIYRIVWKVTRVIYVKTSEAVFLVLSTYFGGQQQIKPTTEANIILQVAIFSRRVVVDYISHVVDHNSSTENSNLKNYVVLCCWL